MTPNGSGAINAVQIDAVAQTIQWSGGSAPSAGSSGKDIYTFTILKTGSGTTDYEVFGAATNYAIENIMKIFIKEAPLLGLQGSGEVLVS